MRFLKSVFVLGILLLLFTVSGCNTTSDQRVALLEGAVVQAEKVSGELEIRLDEMELILVKTQAALNDPNLPVDFQEQLNDLFTQTIDGIKVISAKRGEYAGLITRLREQIEEAKEGGIDLGAELQLYGKGLETTAEYLPPVVSGYVTLAGTVFGILGLILAKRRKKELVGVVKSVDKLLTSEAITDTEAATKVLKDAQKETAGLRAAIRKVH